MLKYVYNKFKQFTKVLAFTSLMGFQQAPSDYVVKPKDTLYEIAQTQVQTLKYEEVVEETNRIAKNNDMGTIQEYPWSEGYECIDDQDPNCIYPGQKLKLEREEAPPTNPLAPILPLILGAGAVAYSYGRRQKKDLDNALEDLVKFRNKHPRHSLDQLVNKIEGNIYKEGNHLRQPLRQHLRRYKKGKTRTKIVRYDHQLASKDMKKEMITMYKKSEKNLEQVAEHLTEKYGMNISSSTISRRARKELEVNSREEAKNQA